MAASWFLSGARNLGCRDMELPEMCSMTCIVVSIVEHSIVMISEAQRPIWHCHNMTAMHCSISVSRLSFASVDDAVPPPTVSGRIVDEQCCIVADGQ